MWNARLLEGELGEAVRKLKDELDGDVFVSGCGELARNLLREGAVDEVLFWVRPVVWGDGARPFEGETVRMRLIGSEAFDSGETLLRYEPLPPSVSSRSARCPRRARVSASTPRSPR
jgi:dihydrofolate reductase